MKIRPSISIGIFTAVAALAVLLWWALTKFEQQSGESPSVRIAAILNLTGPAARFDAPKQNTLEIAQQRLKAIYPDLPLDVRIFDGGSGPEGASIAVRKATEWGARYYLSGTSPTALAIASQVRGRVPPVAQLANAANPDFGPPRIGEYRFWPDWKQEADLIADLLTREKWKDILLIYSADPYSNALREELDGHLKSGHISLTSVQFDPASTPDFRPALIRAQRAGAQAVVVFGLPPGLTALLNQMKEVDWNAATVGGVNINIVVPTFEELGLKGPLWLVETEAMEKEPQPGSEVATYRTLYQQKYGELPAFYTLYLADALYFIAAAADRSSSATEYPVDALDTVSEFTGASGTIRITSSRTLEFVMHVRQAN